MSSNNFETQLEYEDKKPNAITETDAQTITRLAALSPIDYDRARKDAALKLRVSVGALDKQVQQEQASYRKESVESKEIFTIPEPWPEEVNPTALLDELGELFKRYAVLPTHADTALALWVCFTWGIDACKIAPILALSSPEMQCGKTTVLSLLTRLVYRPMAASNISPAALFAL